MDGDEVPAQTFHGGKASSLSRVMVGASTWERGLVPIGGITQVGLWASMALCLALVAGDVWVQRPPLTDTAPAYFIFGWPWTRALMDQGPRLLPIHAGLAVAGILAAVLTGGFRLAGHRVLLGLATLLALVAVSLLAPMALLIIVVANGLLWLLYGALVLVIAVAAVVLLIAILCS